MKKLKKMCFGLAILLFVSSFSCGTELKWGFKDELVYKQNKEFLEQIKALSYKLDSINRINVAQYIIQILIVYQLWHIGVLLKERY
jgi:hypothetical protein